VLWDRAPVSGSGFRARVVAAGSRTTRGSNQAKPRRQSLRGQQCDADANTPISS
jgi:hypothetical protein